MCATVLDDVRVRLDRLLEHVGRIAGGAEAHDLEHRALVGDPLLQAPRISLVSAIGLPLESWYSFLRQLARLVVDHDRLGRRRSAVHADHQRSVLLLLQRHRVEPGNRVVLAELVELRHFLDERRPRRLPSRDARPWAMNSFSASMPR